MTSSVSISLRISSIWTSPQARVSQNVSLAVAALQQADEPARERIRATVIENVSAYDKDGKVRVRGVARCIVGTK